MDGFFYISIPLRKIQTVRYVSIHETLDEWEEYVHGHRQNETRTVVLYLA